MIRQLTFNNKDDVNPAIDENLIVYEHSYSSSDIDIHLYDLTTGTVKLINNSTSSQTRPDISGNRIVYQEPYHDSITNFDGVKVWTVLTDGSGITNLISDRLPSINYSNPIIEGNIVIYEGSWTTSDGTFIQGLSSRDVTKDLNDTINNLRSISNNGTANSAAMSGNQVVYLDDDYREDGVELELWLEKYDDPLSASTKIVSTDGSKSISSPSIDGNLVVYTLTDINSRNSDIYLYDITTGTNRAIANSSDYEGNARISGNKIVWQQTNGNNREIWAGLSDGSYNILLASNPSIGRPAISGNTVVWSQWDGNDWEIFSADLSNDLIDPTSLNALQYGASHTDLIGIYGYNLEALQQHYINYGRAERRSIDNFDEFRYIASNADLLNVYGANGDAATEHYIRYGYGEGRPITTFDSARYLLSNPDLLNAYGTNIQSASYHYVAFGSKPPENRNINGFASDRYLASHPDLIGAFGYNLVAGSEHYLYRVHTGAESRSITFSPENYLALNPDIAAHPYFGQSLTNATQHYILYGLNEGRS